MIPMHSTKNMKFKKMERKGRKRDRRSVCERHTEIERKREGEF